MEQLKIQQAANAVIFSVKVVPRSSKTAVAGILGGMLKVKLAAAPEKGKANESLVEFLADTLGVKKNAVSITSGLYLTRQNNPNHRRFDGNDSPKARFLS